MNINAYIEKMISHHHGGILTDIKAITNAAPIRVTKNKFELMMAEIPANIVKTANKHKYTVSVYSENKNIVLIFSKI